LAQLRKIFALHQISQLLGVQETAEGGVESAESMTALDEVDGASQGIKVP
jgi:hypothetical protein